jgi:hypothetical protein
VADDRGNARIGRKAFQQNAFQQNSFPEAAPQEAPRRGSDDVPDQSGVESAFADPKEAPEPRERPAQSNLGPQRSVRGTPPPNESPSPPNVDDDASLAAILAQLSEGAMKALSLADLVRRSNRSSSLHVDHLLFALNKVNPPTHEAIAEHLNDESFRAILEDMPGTDPPDEAIASVSPLREMPPRSAHVAWALRDARDGVVRRGERSIVGAHLFKALMSVPTCTPITRLREQGVTGEVRLDTKPFRVYSAAKADQPTDIDLIGHGKIADALVELLTGQSTTFPLTLAIAAPWGGGKSSLMTMLECRLRQLESSGQPSWLNVQFPAWRYETGEQVWAAMAKATYDAALERRNLLSAWWFRLRLEMQRGGALGGLVRPTVSAVAGAAGATVGSFLLPAATGTSDAVAGAAAGGVTALAVFGQGVWRVLGDPFKRALESFAENPRVEKGDGFTAAAAKQVDALMRLLLAGGGRVAIFIDDLDRCTPRNLVRVVEAVNQIFIYGSALASSDGEDRRSRIQRLLRRPNPAQPRLVFVLGMDRRVVARGIETEYGQLMDRMKEAKDDARTDFGMAFLDKIVQLWVTLPRPTEPQMEALLASVNNRVEVRGSGADEAAVTAQRKRLDDALAQSEGSASRSTRIAVVKELTKSADPDEAGALREASQAFLAEAAAPDATDSDQVWDALLVGLKCLDANPRQIKRYNNAFRLQLNVAARSERVTFSAEQLSALARYVAIRLRWPNVGAWLDDDFSRLSALETMAESSKPNWPVDGLELDAVADSDDLLSVVQSTNGQMRISALPFDDFLAIA